MFTPLNQYIIVEKVVSQSKSGLVTLGEDSELIQGKVVDSISPMAEIGKKVVFKKYINIGSILPNSLLVKYEDLLLIER